MRCGIPGIPIQPILWLVAAGLLAGCPANDDDDSTADDDSAIDDDDDDSENEIGPMSLTLVTENQTEQTLVAFGWSIQGNPSLQALTDPITPGGLYSQGLDVPGGVEYGTFARAEVIAQDGAGTCYDWKHGGEDVELGPEVVISAVLVPEDEAPCP